MGLTISDAIRLVLMWVADEQRLPFDVKVPNATSRRAMDELDKGKGKRSKSAPPCSRILASDALTPVRSSQRGGGAWLQRPGRCPIFGLWIARTSLLGYGRMRLLCGRAVSHMRRYLVLARAEMSLQTATPTS
jgi:hypothetical protein